MSKRLIDARKPISSLSMLLLSMGLLTLSSCGGCNEKSNKFRASAGNPPPTEIPTPDPIPTPEPTPTTPPDDEPVPPITTDKASNIDTKSSAALKHLIFETSPNLEAGRYLDEFLIAIYSREKSCVRLKVRPTAGISAEVDESVLQNSKEGTGDCSGQKILGESAPEEEPTEEEGLTVRRELAYEFVTDSSNITPGFGLASQTAAICSGRKFRMESATTNADPLAKIFTKTGRLLHVGSRVRVWLDEEYANVCSGGSNLDGRSPFGYGILASNGNWPYSYVSKLWMAHIESLASEMDKIIGDMTALYGPISDIDQSGYIEIFASPDVNRSQFILYEATKADRFRAIHKFKPQDLAYYNSATNPTGNEGEILYMYTPDQGGIYNGIQFPSADSFATNYAKGFLTAQAMNLIIANQKLLVQKQKKMEDHWLADSLASLASMYYAGNDYLFASLAHYLTSRPQYISINNGPDLDLISKEYETTGGEEVRGMRAMFGWYLHARLCGATSVAPCDKIKNFIDSQEFGTKNVESILGESFDSIMINFSLSVGAGMTTDPAAVLALWQDNSTTLPAIPLLLPDLEEIYKDKPPVTEESDSNAALLTDSKIDKTQAGPFPSRDSLLFQTLTSDNDMEFKTAENSVTYILVTGLVESTTDVTAFFGKGLNVTFIPIGERDTNKRRIHIEKVSELAHRDLRPTNLTQQAEAHKTNRYDPEYDNLDFSVTTERELWILGSIDNYQENVEGAMTTIGDSDAYTIDIQPCAGKVGVDLIACQGENHPTVMQVHIRDFDKELAPMMFVTTNDASIYRGASVYGRVQDLDPDFDSAENVEDFLCQAESSWNGAGSDHVCDNAGLGIYEPMFTGKLTALDSKAYAHPWSNFGMLSPHGFPYTNRNTISFSTPVDCEGYNCYNRQEHLRQHFNFTFQRGLKTKLFKFWSTSRNLSISESSSNLSIEEISTLAMLKDKIDTPGCTAPSDNFIEECQTIEPLNEALCSNICTQGTDIQTKIMNWISVEKKTLLCKPGSLCTDETDLTTVGANTLAWVNPSSLLWYETTTESFSTYYKPIEPKTKQGYCSGDPVDPLANQRQCQVKDNPDISDIRHQLNVKASEIYVAGCDNATIGTDFKVCFDDISYRREIEPGEPYAYRDGREKLETDRTRQYYYSIATRSGEVLSKPERLQMIHFRTPGIGAKVNIVIGGRKQSQGKYLIRTRLKGFEPHYYPD